ncbi:Uncharacterised protein [Yersinia enterocolitica]|nr:Uncharacterised protein [Yersinia enterocolitica]
MKKRKNGLKIARIDHWQSQLKGNRAVGVSLCFKYKQQSRRSAPYILISFLTGSMIPD